MNRTVTDQTTQRPHPIMSGIGLLMAILLGIVLLPLFPILAIIWAGDRLLSIDRDRETSHDHGYHGHDA